MKIENITMENEKEFLATQYPEVVLDEETVQFDPTKHTMEKGEAAYCLDIETGIVSKGIIEHVSLSVPMNYPTYTIGGKYFMYHRVWPNVEGQRILDSLNKRNLLKEALLRLSPEEQALVY